jgi:outer membrane receptor protein involved in Fe transport
MDDAQHLLAQQSGNVHDLAGLQGPTLPSATPAADSFEDLTRMERQVEIRGGLAQTPKPTAPPPGEKTGEDEGELLEEVNVQATKRPTPPRVETRQTSSTFKLEKEALNATGAPTLSDAIRVSTPSYFAPDSLGGIDTSRATFLRGLDSRRYIVSVDGRPTANPITGRSLDLGRASLSNVERVEILNGPQTLRYSSSAISGLVNIITRLPDSPRLEVKSEWGSYGFNLYRVDLANTNGIEPKKGGYIGYEFNYERRSATNNYTGTYYQAPFGEGTSFNGGQQGVSAEFLNQQGVSGLPATEEELANLAVDIDLNFPTLVFPAAISFNKQLNAGYVFSDNYAAKLVYKPGDDHTLTFSFTGQSSRIGDSFASPNFDRTCAVRPPFFGVDPRVLDSFQLREPKFTSSSVDCSIGSGTFVGRGDQADDDVGFSLRYEWKITPQSILSARGSVNSAFIDAPSSFGARLTSAAQIDVQLNYASALSAVNDLNLGFQYTSDRYSATPVPGTGGNQPFFRNNQGIYTSTPPQGVAFAQYNAVTRAREQWSVYLTDQWRFFDQAVILDLATRLTTDSDFGTFVSPGAGLRFNFGGPRGDLFGLRGSYFQTFRSPGLAQRFGYAASTFSFGVNNSSQPYLPNPLLQPETAVNYELGLDINISPSALFRVTYFRSDINRGIVDNVLLAPQIGSIPDAAVGFVRPPGTPDLQPGTFLNPAYRDAPEGLLRGCGDGTQATPNSSPLQPVINGIFFCSSSGVLNAFTNFNAQSYLSTGWELSFQWDVTPQWTLRANYGTVDARAVGNPAADIFVDATTGFPIALSTAGIEGGYFYGFPAIDVPFNTTNVQVGYKSPGGFQANLIGLFVGPRPRANGSVVFQRPFSRWDFTFAIPLTENLKFTGGVFNIFNDQSILADRGFNIGGSLLYPPTNFKFGIVASFGGPSGQEGQPSRPTKTSRATTSSTEVQEAIERPVKRGYVSASGGVLFPYGLAAPEPTLISLSTATVDPTPTPLPFNPLDLQTGFSANGAAGYRFGVTESTQIRAEIEFSYMNSAYTFPNPPQVEAINSNFLPSSGQPAATGVQTLVAAPRVQNFAIMANTYYDFVLGSVKPYIGFGLGYDIFVTDPVVYLSQNTIAGGADLQTRAITAVISDSQTEPELGQNGVFPVRTSAFSQGAFAYQARAGVAVDLTETIEGVFGYRFFGTSPIGTPSGQNLGNQSIHSLELGMRLAF